MNQDIMPAQLIGTFMHLRSDNINSTSLKLRYSLLLGIICKYSRCRRHKRVKQPHAAEHPQKSTSQSAKSLFADFQM